MQWRPWTGETSRPAIAALGRRVWGCLLPPGAAPRRVRRERPTARNNGDQFITLRLTIGRWPDGDCIGRIGEVDNPRVYGLWHQAYPRGDVSHRNPVEVSTPRPEVLPAGEVSARRARSRRLARCDLAAFHAFPPALLASVLALLLADTSLCVRATGGKPARGGGEGPRERRQQSLGVG